MKSGVGCCSPYVCADSSPVLFSPLTPKLTLKGVSSIGGAKMEPGVSKCAPTLVQGRIVVPFITKSLEIETK